MRISENSEAPQVAKEVALLCPHCNRIAYVKLPYQPTAQERQDLIKEAIDEHRQVCLAAPSDAGRVTQIMYPRTR